MAKGQYVPGSRAKKAWVCGLLESHRSGSKGWEVYLPILNMSLAQLVLEAKVL